MSDFGNDPVLDRAYLVDLAPDGIADDQRLGRLESKANAARRSGEDEIARLERHGQRQLGDLLPDVEDQVPGIGVLAKLAVDKGAQPQDVRVSDLVGGCDARAKGAVRIERFSEHPLCGLPLPIANGDVISDRITEDVFPGALYRNSTAFLADDDDEFDFVVKLVRHDRLVDSAERRVHGSRLLAEPDLLGRDLHPSVPGLLDMIRIVQSYGENLARTFDRRKQGRVANRGNRTLRNSFRERPLYVLPAIDNADHVDWRIGKEIAERNDRIIDHYAGFRRTVVGRKTHQFHGFSFRMSLLAREMAGASAVCLQHPRSSLSEIEHELRAPHVELRQLPGAGLHRKVLVPRTRLAHAQLGNEYVHLGVEPDQDTFGVVVVGS